MTEGERERNKNNLEALLRHLSRETSHWEWKRENDDDVSFRLIRLLMEREFLTSQYQLQKDNRETAAA